MIQLASGKKLISNVEFPLVMQAITPDLKKMDKEDRQKIVKRGAGQYPWHKKNSSLALVCLEKVKLVYLDEYLDFLINGFEKQLDKRSLHTKTIWLLETESQIIR